jgi:hypothetical protein
MKLPTPLSAISFVVGVSIGAWLFVSAFKDLL